MKNLFALAATLALLIGCSEKEANPEAAEKTTPTPPAALHASIITTDWEGGYTASLPCADCEGIRYAIYLNRDETYIEQKRYLGKSEQIFYNRGHFEWNDQGNVIILKPQGNNGEARFALGENMLTKLDANGAQITGNLAAQYTLVKTLLTLERTPWKPIELFGTTILANQQAQKDAYVLFDGHTMSYSGFSGCNAFRGEIKALDAIGLALASGTTTLAACQNSEIEGQFFAALQKTDTYALRGSTLTLYGGKEIVAKLEPILIR